MTQDIVEPSPSFARAAWLADAARLAEKKELIDPPSNEIPKMLAAVGDDPTFLKLNEANKAKLFLAMYNVRLWLETYDRVVEFEEEPPKSLLETLGALVAALPQCHGLLSVAVDMMSEIRGSTVKEAWGEVARFAGDAELLRQVVERIAAEPKAYDKRKVGSRRQRREAVMIRDCLDVLGVKVKLTAGNYEGKDDPGLVLAGRMVGYTSGAPIEAKAFAMRLSRAKNKS